MRNPSNNSANALLDNDEILVGLAVAGKQFGAHPTTVMRWIHRGILHKSGHRVRLEAVRRGGKLLTSHEAVKRFFAELSPRIEAPACPSPGERRRAVELAMKELVDSGA